MVILWRSTKHLLWFYFVANEVNDAAKKRAILLSVSGAEKYKLLQDLIYP